jgi:putative membrane protein
MLVFRNSTSYERYWGGRTGLQSIVTCVRNLTRSFLIHGFEGPGDRAETEMTVRCLVALLYAVKNYLRGNWGVAGYDPAYSNLLPRGMKGHESEGLGLPLELCFFIEQYIHRGSISGAFNAPQSAMLSSQVNELMKSFGAMETIKLTPIPVCHQIHQKQVLALYCCVLPFCLVNDLGWYAIPVVAMVCFTLYGIEGIGGELEDPFGENKNDIKIDAIIEDAKQEIMVLLDCWKKSSGEELFSS